MRPSLLVLVLAAAVPAARAEKPDAGAGVEAKKRADVPKTPRSEPPPAPPEPAAMKPPARKPADKAATPGKPAAARKPAETAPDDREVVEHLELLLLLDLLSDYELFEERPPGATFSAPGRLKEYRP